MSTFTPANGIFGGAIWRRIVRWMSRLSLARLFTDHSPPAIKAGSKPYTSSGPSGPSFLRAWANNGLSLMSVRSYFFLLDIAKNVWTALSVSGATVFTLFSMAIMAWVGQLIVTERLVFSPHTYSSPNAVRAIAR